jgi:hypothetical protein
MRPKGERRLHTCVLPTHAMPCCMSVHKHTYVGMYVWPVKKLTDTESRGSVIR